jgi:hypothetical protein
VPAWRFRVKLIAATLQQFVPVGPGRPARRHTVTGELLEEARPAGFLRKMFSLYHARWSLLPRPAIGFKGTVPIYAKYLDEGTQAHDVSAKGYLSAEDLAERGGVGVERRAGRALMIPGRGGDGYFFRRHARVGGIRAQNFIRKGLDAVVSEHGLGVDSGALSVGWARPGEAGVSNG